jgi:hypothetical protein
MIFQYSKSRSVCLRGHLIVAALPQQCEMLLAELCEDRQKIEMISKSSWGAGSGGKGWNAGDTAKGHPSLWEERSSLQLSLSPLKHRSAAA